MVEHIQDAWEALQADKENYDKLSIALDVGIRNGSPLYILIWLFEQCRALNPAFGKGLLRRVALYDVLDFMRWLLDVARLDPNGDDDGYSPLYDANIEGAQILLEAGADVNHHRIVGGSHWERGPILRNWVGIYASSTWISLLLRHGADPYLILGKDRQGIVTNAHLTLMYRAIYLPILLSPRLVPRLGRNSAIRLLPTELVRLVGTFF